jgi:hypothetical protein
MLGSIVIMIDNGILPSQNVGGSLWQTWDSPGSMLVYTFAILVSLRVLRCRKGSIGQDSSDDILLRCGMTVALAARIIPARIMVARKCDNLRSD